MLEALLVTLIIGLPLFCWRTEELGREYPLTIIMGLVLIIFCVMATKGIGIMVDNVTIVMICFWLIIISSLAWSTSHKSFQESLVWTSLLVFCLLCRYVNPDVILGSIAIIGTAFGVMSPIQSKFLRHPVQHPPHYKFHFVFGNPTHNAAFAIIPFFVSLYACYNISLWFLPFILINGWVFFYSHNFSSYLGLVAGLIVSCFLLKISYGLLSLIAITIAGFALYKLRPNFFNSWNSSLGQYDSKKRAVAIRIIYLYACWIMFKKRYLYGFGLNMFRKLYPDLNPTLQQNKRIMGWYKLNGGIQMNTGHRPHNDLADILTELGLVGLVVFIAIFFQIDWKSIDPFLIGGFVAYVVMSLFFFPLREVHTAIIFWALVGVFAGKASLTTFTIHPVIAIIIILMLMRLIFIMVIRTLGLYFFDSFQKAKTPQDADVLLQNAINCDPYNARYLMWGFIKNIEEKPHIAFEFAVRQLLHFDGNKVKWGVWDQFARAVLKFSGWNIAEWALLNALHLNPEYKQSAELLAVVQTAQMQSKMQREAINGINNRDTQPSPAIVG